MKTYAICDADGFARFETTLSDDAPPPEFPGMTVAEVEERLPDPPFSGASYHVPSKKWVDVRSLGERKAVAWASIKAARDAAERGGFEWDGSLFDSDDKSQARIQGAVVLASSVVGYSVEWTLADNTVRALQADDVLQMGAALGAHVNAQHQRGRALRAEIDAAATPEELAAIRW